MFAIITQLQLPQSCRHSNGAGCPSRAAKWQEGARALWAGRGGVARAPGTVPPAPFVGSPARLPPPQRPEGKGLCLGTGRLVRPRGGPSRRLFLLPGGGARGSRCQEGWGCSGSLWLRAQLGTGVATWVPTAHPRIPGSRHPQCHLWAFSGRVFMTHSPIYPARVLVEPGQEQDWLCWGLTMGEAPGLEQCLGTPRILPSQHPFAWGPPFCEHSSYEGDCAYCHFTDEETEAREIM